MEKSTTVDWTSNTNRRKKSQEKQKKQKKRGNHSQESNKRKLEVIINKWVYVYFIVH